MFAVHGIDPKKLVPKAKKCAEKSLSKKAAKTKPSEAELKAAEDAELARLLETSEPKKISPEFGIPAAAETFKSMAERSGFVRLIIMIKVPQQATDRKGRLKMVNRFVPFVPGYDYGKGVNA